MARPLHNPNKLEERRKGTFLDHTKNLIELIQKDVRLGTRGTTKNSLLDKLPLSRMNISGWYEHPHFITEFDDDQAVFVYYSAWTAGYVDLGQMTEHLHEIKGDHEITIAFVDTTSDKAKAWERAMIWLAFIRGVLLTSADLRGLFDGVQIGTATVEIEVVRKKGRPVLGLVCLMPVVFAKSSMSNSKTNR